MPEFDRDSQFLKSNAAAMRALAGGKDHQVTYAGTDTHVGNNDCLLYTSPSPRDRQKSRMPSSA